MTDKYPLSRTLTGRERDLLAQKRIGDARIGYSTDTNKLMFYEGTKWVGADSEGVTQFSSSSSGSSQSSSSSSMSSSSSRSSSSSSSMSSSSESSSSSSQDREIYPTTPVLNQQVTPNIQSADVDIYTVINIEANITQVFSMDVGLFEIELTGLFVYTGGLSDLTTQGTFIPLEGSYAFSVGTTTVEPEFMMSLASRFITSLKTEKKTITIADKDYQRIIFEPIPQVHILDGTITLGATATSGLSVEYESSDTSKVTIAGNVATLLTDGDVTITARQPGNNDFEEAIEVEQRLKIKPRIIIEIDSSNNATNSGLFVGTTINAYVDYTIAWWQNIEFSPTNQPFFYSSPDGYWMTIYDDGSANMQTPNNVGGAFPRLYRSTDASDPIHASPQSVWVIPGTFKENEWQHVAFTRNTADRNNKLYIDGALVATYYVGFNGLTLDTSTTAFNGGYNAILPSTTNRYEIREDGGTYQTGDDTWLLNGKPIYLRYHGGSSPVTPWFYTPEAAIYWSSVHNKWVLTDSVFNYQTDWTLPHQPYAVQKLTFSTSSAYGCTGWIATDNLSYGFYQNSSGVLSGFDSGLLIGDGGGYMGRNQYASYTPTPSEIRAEDMSVLNDTNQGGISQGLFFGRPYSTTPVDSDRKLTEVAIWEHTFLNDADIQTVYNLGHSNSKDPSPTILGLNGGPAGYFRGGMDDFLSSVAVKNVGIGPVFDGERMPDLATLEMDTNLIKYEP